MLVDSHAHLDLQPAGQVGVDDLEEVLSRAKAEGIGKIVTVGTSIESSKKCIEIADPPSHKAPTDVKALVGRSKGQENIPEIYATCGTHPRDGKGDVKKFGLHYIDILKSVAKSSDKVVGVGEAGLDYHLTADNEQLTTDEEKEFQRKLFIEQIGLAVDLNLPLIIHCRNAWDDIFQILSNVSGQLSSIRRAQDDPEFTEGSNVTGVFHSWTGNWETAKKALDLGFYISFSGIVTFKNAPDVQAVARRAPLDRILVETDSPFLTPVPLRGKQNEPKNVRIVAQFLASLRNQPVDQIIEVTADNAQKLFGI